MVSFCIGVRPPIPVNTLHFVVESETHAVFSHELARISCTVSRRILTFELILINPYPLPKTNITEAPDEGVFANLAEPIIVDESYENELDFVPTEF
jgi:hypothetical protein